eukprot:762891-Hanusia_phi.AAC.2
MREKGPRPRSCPHPRPHPRPHSLAVMWDGNICPSAIPFKNSEASLFFTIMNIQSEGAYRHGRTRTHRGISRLGGCDRKRIFTIMHHKRNEDSIGDVDVSQEVNFLRG